MMKRLSIAAFLVLIVAPLPVLAAGKVEIYQNGSPTAKMLPNVERLADVVGQPWLAESWWPGAVISERQATLKAREAQQALLGRLSALAVDEDDDDAAVINTLRQQVQALNVTGRQMVNLDPDRVRLVPRANPPLAGDYTLWVGREPTTVRLFGLISHPGQQPFTPGRDVASYLDTQELLSGADRSYAWVIYPDGRSEKAPVAYWNRRHIEPTPGSVIFVGFASSLWTNKYDELNAEILHTLAQRIPE